MKNRKARSFVAIMIVIALVTGFFAGSYPAFHLSNFNPAFSLKGGLANSFGALLVRKGLVVFQFTVSVIFIVSVFVIYKPGLYNKDMRFLDS